MATGIDNRKATLIKAAIKHFTKNEMCLTVEAIVAYLNSTYSITEFSVYEVAQIFRENTRGES